MSGGSADQGSVPVEFAAGVALLVLPVALLVATLPQWVEHQSAARLAAREAARAVAVAEDPVAAQATAEALAFEVLANHGITGDAVQRVDVTVPVGPDGRVARGGDAVAHVRVVVPVTVTPLTGTIGGFAWSASHREPIDPYRSLP
jgi:hypothetical protein